MDRSLSHLNILNEDVLRHLNILINSIKVITPDFLKCLEPDGLEVEQVERAFTYELYYQWKNNLQGENLTINAEIRKRKTEDEYIYPDFVLHKSQSNNDDMNQFFVCEVKRHMVSKEGLIKDFRNILYHLINPHPFAYGVFIQLGRDFNKVNQNITPELFNAQMKEILGDRFYESFSHPLIGDCEFFSKRIICVSYNPFVNPSLKIKTLYDIMLG